MSYDFDPSRFASNEKTVPVPVRTVYNGKNRTLVEYFPLNGAVFGSISPQAAIRAKSYADEHGNIGTYLAYGVYNPETRVFMQGADFPEWSFTTPNAVPSVVRPDLVALAEMQEKIIAANWATTWARCELFVVRRRYPHPQA